VKVVRTLDMIVPYHPFRQQQTSYDLTASGIAYTEITSGDNPFPVIDIRAKQPLRMEELAFDESIIILPGGAMTVLTQEEIVLDGDTCAMFQAVGTLNTANVGIVGGIWIQPGWRGRLRVALRNYNRVHAYKLYHGAVLGQLVLFNVREGEKTDEHY
jgi:deoxycytidine triphosphate deaminase